MLTALDKLARNKCSGVDGLTDKFFHDMATQIRVENDGEIANWLLNKINRTLSADHWPNYYCLAKIAPLSKS